MEGGPLGAAHVSISRKSTEEVTRPLFGLLDDNIKTIYLLQEVPCCVFTSKLFRNGRRLLMQVCYRK